MIILITDMFITSRHAKRFFRKNISLHKLILLILSCCCCCCCQVASVMSDSVRLHSPWDSLGKNTGVGCHFLLQCMKMKSESEVAQSCRTRGHPMDCSQPGSSVHGILQARVLEQLAIAFSVILSQVTLIQKRGVFSLCSGSGNFHICFHF